MSRKKQLVNPKQGERLTELLRDSNISQEKLGEILGFQQQAISFFVTGKRALPQWAAEGIESRLGIRAAYILGLSDIKTQKEIEDLFDAGWNDADKSDNGADPFLSCLGYRVKPELIENTDAVPWGTGHGEDEVIPPECLAWNFSGKYEIWHNGEKVAGGFCDSEIDRLKQEIRDIFDYAETRVQRFISSIKDVE